MTPRVTAIIDTYNHERFIEQAVVSVLEQDFPRGDFEVLVIDDGSTDRTPEILRKFEPQVRVLRKANGGQASAFNASIPEARGEFIAFLDGDDWWLPGKLARAMKAFEEDPTLGLVGHGDVCGYPDGTEMLHVLHEDTRFRADTVEGARIFRVRKSFVGTSRATYRASVLRQILPVPESLRFQADEYVFTLGAALCDVRLLPEALFYYRFHDANAFQFSGADANKVRAKQQVLSQLAQILNLELRKRGIAERAVRAIVDYLQADANQLRLMVDGGWPWETVKTEWAISSIMYEDASAGYRLCKGLSLLPALAIPPKLFYSARQKIANSGLYRRAREKWIAIPEMSHIQKQWRTGG